VNENDFDGMARRAAGQISRRGSLMTLGAAALTGLASPLAAWAKKSKSGKKAKRQCQQQLTDCNTQASQCADQEQQCTTFLEINCPSNLPGCLAQAACCASLRNCDISGFLTCLVTGIA
jgi:hypothetical protein